MLVHEVAQRAGHGEVAVHAPHRHRAASRHDAALLRVVVRLVVHGHLHNLVKKQWGRGEAGELGMEAYAASARHSHASPRQPSESCNQSSCSGRAPTHLRALHQDAPGVPYVAADDMSGGHDGADGGAAAVVVAHRDLRALRRRNSVRSEDGEWGAGAHQHDSVGVATVINTKYYTTLGCGGPIAHSRTFFKSSSISRKPSTMALPMLCALA